MSLSDERGVGGGVSIESHFRSLGSARIDLLEGKNSSFIWASSRNDDITSKNYYLKMMETMESEIGIQPRLTSSLITLLLFSPLCISSKWICQHGPAMSDLIAP